MHSNFFFNFHEITEASQKTSRNVTSISYLSKKERVEFLQWGISLTMVNCIFLIRPGSLISSIIANVTPYKTFLGKFLELI